MLEVGKFTQFRERDQKIFTVNLLEQGIPCGEENDRSPESRQIIT